jgi:hypothetical protein
MEKPDIAELLTQIGLRNAQELKLLIEDTTNIPDVAQRFDRFYEEYPLAKDTLALLFENYPFIPESTRDLISLLQKARQIFRFFSDQKKELDTEHFEKGLKFSYKLVYKILFSSPENVFKKDFLDSLEESTDQKESPKKAMQRNRYNFVIMLRVIIDQGYMLWGEGTSHFEPMFRDRLDIYRLKEEIMEELLTITREVSISYFLAVYLYLFFIVPRQVK